jgi:4-hydroxy-tetrahydrodipicolinate reductase
VIRVCVSGITAWTGRAVADAVDAATDLELVAGVSRSDPEHFSSVAAIERRVGVVVGSSGLSAADDVEIDARAQEQQVGVIAIENSSVTAALLLRLAK